MIQEKLLGQLRPSGTSALSVYTVPSDTTTIIKNMTVANVGSATIKYSIFASSGTTYDETTALAWEIDLEAGDTHVNTSFTALTEGNIAFKVDTANDGTITIFGAEIT